MLSIVQTSIQIMRMAESGRQCTVCDSAYHQADSFYLFSVVRFGMAPGHVAIHVGAKGLHFLPGE
jgi:hypothetical protein